MLDGSASARATGAIGSLGNDALGDFALFPALALSSFSKPDARAPSAIIVYEFDAGTLQRATPSKHRRELRIAPAEFEPLYRFRRDTRFVRKLFPRPVDQCSGGAELSGRYHALLVTAVVPSSPKIG
jgi:hypothetical protein